VPDALLTTKLHIPQAAIEFVPRPHLTARLDKGVRRKLTLVSAPAGFGKSTLVADWIHHRGGVLPPPTAAVGRATTAPLQAACAAVTNAGVGDVTANVDCHRILDEIRIANLFLLPLGRTTSGAGDRWFRYHHLFADLLRTLLERDRPGASAALHRRAERFRGWAAFIWPDSGSTLEAVCPAW
jgi:ATP/maltotriose-dependent transcriptional regulator MalT